MVSGMDKKQINSPKLTVNFLVWVGLFLLAMVLLIAHFVWRIF
jgi:cytochrome bd-type quinol oxidase subunit 2